MILDLDAIPMPAFHLYPDLTPDDAPSLELGRGCPFACRFCSTNDFFRRKFRLKSPETVIAQMTELNRRYGSRRFRLVHDMFTVDRRRVVEFCEAMLAADTGFTWGCSARTDCVDDELIDLMARAGCRSIFFGIETGSVRLQRVINKRLDLVEAADRVRTTTNHGIATTVSLIIGFPEETKEDLADTVGFFADSMKFDIVDPQANILSPLADTPIHADYRDRLEYMEGWSNICHLGWQQDPEDIELIRRYPDIFPNFYRVPLEWLEHNYLTKLQNFLTQAPRRFRWLLVALHQRTSSLLSVFDAWLDSCRGEHIDIEQDDPPYYARREFDEQFIRFVSRHYLSYAGDAAVRNLRAIIELETSCEALEDRMHTSVRASVQESDLTDPSALPRVAGGVELVQLPGDIESIMECLQAGISLDGLEPQQGHVALRLTSNGGLEIVPLSSRAATLLTLCDGSGTVAEIEQRDRPSDPVLSGGDVASTMIQLNRIGLIEDARLAAGGPFPHDRRDGEISSVSDRGSARETGCATATTA